MFTQVVNAKNPKPICPFDRKYTIRDLPDYDQRKEKVECSIFEREKIIPRKHNPYQRQFVESQPVTPDLATEKMFNIMLTNPKNYSKKQIIEFARSHAEFFSYESNAKLLDFLLTNASSSSTPAVVIPETPQDIESQVQNEVKQEEEVKNEAHIQPQVNIHPIVKKEKNVLTTDLVQHQPIEQNQVDNIFRRLVRSGIDGFQSLTSTGIDLVKQGILEDLREQKEQQIAYEERPKIGYQPSSPQLNFRQPQDRFTNLPVAFDPIQIQYKSRFDRQGREGPQQIGYNEPPMLEYVAQEQPRSAVEDERQIVVRPSNWMTQYGNQLDEMKEGQTISLPTPVFKKDRDIIKWLKDLNVGHVNYDFFTDGSAGKRTYYNPNVDQHGKPIADLIRNTDSVKIKMIRSGSVLKPQLYIDNRKQLQDVLDQRLPPELSDKILGYVKKFDKLDGRGMRNFSNARAGLLPQPTRRSRGKVSRF